MSEHQADCVLSAATVSDGQQTAAVPGLTLPPLLPSFNFLSLFFGDCNFRPVTIFVTL